MTIHKWRSVFTWEDVNTVPRRDAETAEKLNVVDIWEHDIMEKIENLKQESAPALDGICPRLLKETARIYALTLRLIFESSLREETCPAEWKQANVQNTHLQKRTVKQT